MVDASPRPSPRRPAPSRTLTATVAAALALCAAAPALAQDDAADPPLKPGSRFKCQAGGDVYAQFASQRSGLVAIVDAGDGPHPLALRPWDGGPARIIWTDGRRTLTWSPGVQIMWMDGAEHRMCGRAGGHHH